MPHPNAGFCAWARMQARMRRPGAIAVPSLALLALLALPGCDGILGLQATSAGGDAGDATDATTDGTTADVSAIDVTSADASDGSDEDAAPDTGIADAGAEGEAGSGKLGLLGSACAPSGATACDGNDSQVVLICQGGVWTAYGSPCSASQRCDSTVGACADVVAGCTGLSPGDTFCASGKVEKCGVDLVSTTVVQTCGAHQSCVTGDAGPACQCNSPAPCTIAGSTCGASESYITCQVDADECLYESGSGTCSNGACYGAAGSAQCCTNGCTSGVQSCGANDTIQTCQVQSTGCLGESSTSCSGAPRGPVCISGSPYRCGCVNSLDCSTLGAPDGNVCSSGYCTCSSGSDCRNGGCCNTNDSPAACVANGTNVPSLGTCSNGSF